MFTWSANGASYAESIGHRNVGTFITPRIISPEPFGNASTARHAIWHFGRMIDLLVFLPENHVWRSTDGDSIDDGRHARGEPAVLSIRATLQPNTQKRARGVLEDVSGSRAEVNYIVHLDSHDPVNLKAARKYPVLFPDGIRLADFDEPAEPTGVNFPMAVRFRNIAYKIKQPIALWAGGGDTPERSGAIYRAECQLWRDRFQERDARGADPAWGPSR